MINITVIVVIERDPCLITTSFSFSEAEYAFQTRKKIIPLKMEAGYNADGWLGFILGAKLFFDFSGKYPFEDKMAGLLKELNSAMKTVHGKEVKATQQQVSVV